VEEGVGTSNYAFSCSVLKPRSQALYFIHPPSPPFLPPFLLRPGTQYRTGIYTHTDAQLQAAQKSRDIEQKKHTRPIMTEIKPATVFWPAEVSHQGYLWRGGRFGSAQNAEKGCKDPIRCYG